MGQSYRCLPHRISGRPRMIKVKSRGNETVDQMLRRFKKLCEKEGLIKDMKRVSYFEKPSEKRRRRLRKAQKKEQKTLLEGGTTMAS
jgi:small subunit ribosomal protein S21